MGCHFLLQGIFLTEGSNPHVFRLWHWQADSLPTAPPGKPFSLSVHWANSFLISWVSCPFLQEAFPDPQLGCPSLCSPTAVHVSIIWWNTLANKRKSNFLCCWLSKLQGNESSVFVTLLSLAPSTVSTPQQVLRMYLLSWIELSCLLCGRRKKASWRHVYAPEEI